jgi:hypothetical protein
MDAIAQIIGFRSSQFVAKKRQTSNGSSTFVVGFLISCIQVSEPFDDWRIAFLFLVKDDVDRGHRRWSQLSHFCDIPSRLHSIQIHRYCCRPTCHPIPKWEQSG